jgi:hypothetical protein
MTGPARSQASNATFNAKKFLGRADVGKKSLKRPAIRHSLSLYLYEIFFGASAHVGLAMGVSYVGSSAN